MEARGEDRPTIDVNSTESEWTIFDDDWSMYRQAFLSTATNAVVNFHLVKCCSKQMKVLLHSQINVRSAREDELLTAMKNLAITEADVSGRHIIIALWSYSVSTLIAFHQRFLIYIYIVLGHDDCTIPRIPSTTVSTAAFKMILIFNILLIIHNN